MYPFFKQGCNYDHESKKKKRKNTKQKSTKSSWLKVVGGGERLEESVNKLLDFHKNKIFIRIKITRFGKEIR